MPVARQVCACFQKKTMGVAVAPGHGGGGVALHQGQPGALVTVGKQPIPITQGRSNTGGVFGTVVPVRQAALVVYAAGLVDLEAGKQLVVEAVAVAQPSQRAAGALIAGKGASCEITTFTQSGTEIKVTVKHAGANATHGAAAQRQTVVAPQGVGNFAVHVPHRGVGKGVGGDGKAEVAQRDASAGALAGLSQGAEIEVIVAIAGAGVGLHGEFAVVQGFQAVFGTHAPFVGAALAITGVVTLRKTIPTFNGVAAQAQCAGVGRRVVIHCLGRQGARIHHLIFIGPRFALDQFQ